MIVQLDCYFSGIWYVTAKTAEEQILNTSRRETNSKL